ncbi:MAG: 2-C-methyl-D-erythritol 4-phosphate cytidylyltransferase [Verrucomicrobiae bacterium]|nr:2-C-methyl-D-erythritol 4-phosphate cytidylyltransferase [Verrucomicrobiae bacterium]
MISAVVVAAGSSRRMGKDKLFLPLCGKPVFFYCLEIFEAHPLITEIIMVTRSEAKTLFQNHLPETITKVKQWIEGGKERQHSVWNGLQAANPSNDLVLIHDAARPLITRKIVDAVVDAAQKTGAAVCGSALADTIKEVDEKGFVTKTLDRDCLVAVQTPQIFHASLIREAYQKLMATQEILTDDTAVVERMGKSVQVVLCDEPNLKMTRPQDLIVAEGILQSRSTY